MTNISENTKKQSPLDLFIWGSFIIMVSVLFVAIVCAFFENNEFSEDSSEFDEIMSEFVRVTRKYGVTTEEERDFLCLSYGMFYLPTFEERKPYAFLTVAYSRSIQYKNLGYDSKRITPYHDQLLDKGMHILKAIRTRADADAILFGCGKRLRVILFEAYDFLREYDPY